MGVGMGVGSSCAVCDVCDTTTPVDGVCDTTAPVPDGGHVKDEGTPIIDTQRSSTPSNLFLSVPAMSGSMPSHHQPGQPQSGLLSHLLLSLVTCLPRKKNEKNGKSDVHCTSDCTCGSAHGRGSPPGLAKVGNVP